VIQTGEQFESEAIAELYPFRSKMGARWFHQISQTKPVRNWLIKSLLLACSFGIVYGPPGCGKSFMVSDLALTMAAGALPNADRPEWFGYKGRPFGVIYVVAEGADDFEIRLHAWRREHGVAADAVLPFVFLPTSIDLRSNKADAQKLIEEIKGLSAEMQKRCGVPAELTVIDTVARALAGGNENDSAVMSGFVSNCKLIQEGCNVAVLGVHHGGKETGRGPRGHEALHGAADFEIEVAGGDIDTPNRWVVRKLKAGPAGAAHLFRLRQVKVGIDEDGDDITSCTVVTGKDAAGPKPKDKTPGWKVNDSEREVLAALADTIAKRGVPPPGDLGVPAKVLLVAYAADVKKVYQDTLTATESGDPEEVLDRLGKRWGRATKSLLKFKIIGSKTPLMWFTGKQVQRFNIRGIAADAPTYAEPPADPQPNPDDDYEVPL
jgi:hypothetical protein